MRASRRMGCQQEFDLSGWIHAVRGGQRRGEHLTVVGHTAAMHLRRIAGNTNHSAALDDILRESWLNLAHRPAVEGLVAQRLPWSVLRRASKKERSFHNSLFRTRTRDRLGCAREYTPLLRDGLYLACVVGLVLCLPDLALPVLGGLVVGTVLGSTSESYLHGLVGHATPRTVAIMKRWARIETPRSALACLGPRNVKRKVGRLICSTRWGHLAIHHGLTYRRDHVTQFESPEEQVSVDATLLALDRFGPGFGQTQIDRHYGLRTEKGVRGFLWYMAPPAPLYFIAMALAQFHPLFCLGVLVGAWLPPAATRYIHPYLHASRAKLAAEAGPIVRWIVGKTRYGHDARERHAVHHLRRTAPGQARPGNYSLLKIGDMILNTEDPATTEELLEMDRIGLI